MKVIGLFKNWVPAFAGTTLMLFWIPAFAGTTQVLARTTQVLAGTTQVLARATQVLARATQVNAAPATDPYPFTSTADAARFSTLTRQVRCIVCQHQSIADSGTPIAAGLRQKVYQMVLDKKSDREIKDYLVRRYGEFILLDPRVNSKTMLLWLFPLLGLGVGILMLVRLF